MRNGIGYIVLSTALLAAACDDGESSSEPLGSKSDARSGARAMMNVLGGSTPTSAGLERDDAEGFEFRSGDLGDAVDASGVCPQGGTVRFSGSLEISEIDVDAAADIDVDPDDPGSWPDAGLDDLADLIPTINFEYEVEFDECAVEGVVIDGAITYAMHSAWSDAEQQLDVTWDYAGEVTFSGAVQGECALDFGGSVSAGIDGADVDVTGLEADAYEGSVCGFDANDAIADDTDDTDEGE